MPTFHAVTTSAELDSLRQWIETILLLHHRDQDADQTVMLTEDERQMMSPPVMTDNLKRIGWLTLMALTPKVDEGAIPPLALSEAGLLYHARNWRWEKDDLFSGMYQRWSVKDIEEELSRSNTTFLQNAKKCLDRGRPPFDLITLLLSQVKEQHIDKIGVWVPSETSRNESKSRDKHVRFFGCESDEKSHRKLVDSVFRLK